MERVTGDLESSLDPLSLDPKSLQIESSGTPLLEIVGLDRHTFSHIPMIRYL